MSELLIVSVDYFPKVGGISMMTHHLANAMVRGGNSVRVLAPSDAVTLPDLDFDYELVVDAESDERNREGPSYEAQCTRLAQLLEDLHAARRLDGILLMHPFYYGYAALRYAQSRGIKTGCFFHGFELKSQLLKAPGKHERNGDDRKAGLDLRHSTLRILHESDAVFVNSSVTGELVAAQGRRDYCVTGCGLDQATIDLHCDEFEQKAAKQAAARGLLGIPPSPVVLGYLGRIVPSKNIEFLLRLVATHSDWCVAIAGNGDVDTLAALAAELDVADRFIVLGGLSEADKWNFYTAIDLFCLPSTTLPGGQMEGFGIVLLEATLKGTPVAVSTHGGMRDFVLDNNGIYINIDDCDETAAVLAGYFSDRAAFAPLVRNAQRLLQEKLNYTRISRDIVGAIEGLGGCENSVTAIE